MENLVKQPLPDGWSWKTIGEVATVVSGGTPSTRNINNFENGDIPWITPADLSGYDEMYISKGKRNITAQGLNNSSAKLLPKNTVLFSSRAPIGYVAIAANPLCTNQGFKNFVLKKDIMAEYVYWWLKHIKDIAISLGSGTTFLELSKTNAEKLPFMAVPLVEQKRIADKIEKIFMRLDKVSDCLKRIKQNITYTRSGYLDRFFSNSDAWKTLIDVCEKPQYGWTTKANHNKGTVKLLRTSDITSGKINYHNVPFCSDIPDDVEKYKVNTGDIYISRAGSVGESVLIENSPPLSVFASYLIRFKPNKKIVNEKYLYYFLKSPSYWNAINENKSGIAMPNVNANKLSKIKIPLPSFSEQKRIAKKIEKMFTRLDKIYQNVENAEKYVKMLKKEILNKYFTMSQSNQH